MYNFQYIRFAVWLWWVLYEQDWPVASELVPGGMHFHFCLQRARYDHPIRHKRSHGRIIGKNFEEWGFEITELRSSNGKTTGNRFDFEIAGLLRLNQVRNIEGALCSEIPCLVAPRVARCLCTWLVVFVLIEWLWQFQYPCDFLSHKHYRESNTNLSKRLSTHHYFSLSHTEIEKFETQNRAKVTQGATLC